MLTLETIGEILCCLALFLLPEDDTFQPISGSLPKLDHADTLTSYLQAPKLRNKFLLFRKHLVYGALLWHPELTKPTTLFFLSKSGFLLYYMNYLYISLL
jgi:hypothetical protein